MMIAEFNLNDKVRVVLTAAGAEHYYFHYQGVPQKHLPKLYAGSEWVGPFWELCNIWGSQMFNGQVQNKMPFAENKVEVGDV